MLQRVKSPSYRRRWKLSMPGWRIARRIPPNLKKTQIREGIDEVKARMEVLANV